MLKLRRTTEQVLFTAGKLYIGTATGSLQIYNVSTGRDEAELLEHKKLFSPRGKPIEQLSAIKEVNTLVSRSGKSDQLCCCCAGTELENDGLADGAVYMHSLSELEVLAPSPLPQSKGVLTFSLDTSVQKRPKITSDNANLGTIGQATLRKGAAYRVGGTIARKSGTLGPGTVASLRGMDQLAKEKEERKKQLREGILGIKEDNEADEDTEMTLVSVLAIGLRRKLVFLRWVDGDFWDTKEIVLPHTPRCIVFSTPTMLFLGYSLSEYASLKIPLAADSSVSWLHRNEGVSARQVPDSSTSGRFVDVVQWDPAEEISLPSLPVSTSSQLDAGYGAGIGAAFGSIGAYVGMSGARQKDPRAVAVEDEELLVGRETSGIFLTNDGKPSRREGIEWPITPESTVFLRPYIISVLPPMASGLASKLSFSTPAAFTPTPTIQVLSAKTLAEVQVLNVPHDGAANYVLGLPTLSSGGKPPLFLISSPSDRTEKDGHQIWRLEMERWGLQIDELVSKGQFEEALALLDGLDQVILEDKDQRRTLVQTLHAVHLFSQGEFDRAIEIFLALDTNPAQVLALYPAQIAGALAHPRSEWFKIFGASEHQLSDDAHVGDHPELASSPTGPATPPGRASPRGTPIPREKSRLGSLLVGRRPQSIFGEPAQPPGTPEYGTSPASTSIYAGGSPSKITTNQNPTVEEDRASLRSARERRITAPLGTAERKALDALGKFLADRRRIFKPILEAHPESHVAQTKSQEHRDTAELLAIPSAPLASLTLDQLSDVAQVVDTALLKTFLEIKPALIGSLCRLENWCKVEEVEELLQERKKYSELIALYGGKNMHMKALKLLRKFGEEEDEDDKEERLRPTIRYLQELDGSYIDVILEASHWVLSEDADLGLEIFTADTGKVSSFPRFPIVDDLEKFDPMLCVRYLEFVITHNGESDPALHEKLVFLYLRRATELRKSGDQGERAQMLQKLLTFLELSRQYDAERVLGRLPPAQEDLYEIRATLLGRMGNHEAALGLYVHTLKNIERAEEYCKRAWTMRESRADEEVFLTLIKVLLRPRPGAEKKTSSGKTLDEAVKLIARHGSRIDLVSAFELLPPMVPVKSLEEFISRVLQVTAAKRHETQVMASIFQARDHQLDHGLAALKSKAVKITENRL